MANPGLSIIPKVSKITPRILRVLGCNPGPMTLKGTNTYVVGKGKRRLLIDTGDGQQAEFFLNIKKSINFDKFTLTDIILTHWHDDHIGGVGTCTASVGGVMKSAEKGARIYKFPRKEGEEEIPLPDNHQYSFITDGQMFEADGATLKAIHTPGHTTDHIILHLEEENAIFSGDCILGEGSTVFEDLHDYMLSLKKILDINPKVIYPGHGPAIMNPKDKIEEYIAHRNQREAQILAALGEHTASKLTPMEIVKIVYRDTPENLHVAAAGNVSHHLHKLLKEGKVTNDDDKFGLI